MKNFILSSLAILSLSLVLFSFLPSTITTEVGGVVSHLNDALVSVEVSVLNEESESTGYYEPTDESGAFHLKFNTVEGSDNYLKFSKKYYSTLLTDYVPLRNAPIQRFENINLIRLVPKSEVIRAGGIQNHDIKIYNTHTENSWRQFKLQDIRYFTFIEREANLSSIETSTGKNLTGYWCKVSFKIENASELQHGWFFEESE